MENSEFKYEVIKKDISEYDLSFKLIVVGDSGVGKSCLCIKAIKDYFDDIYAPTVGFNFLSFHIKIEDEILKLQIWDTCGQEAYRSLINSFYRNSSLSILVYSIDDIHSFESLESWLNEIKSQSNPDMKIILIGTKSDLEDKRQVPKEKGEKFCQDHNLCFFMETSAKTGFNAENLFIKAGLILYEEHKKTKDIISRPGSIGTSPNIPGVNIYEPEIEEENRQKNKGCGC